MLEEANGLKIAEAVQVITAVPASRAVASELDVAERAPLLKATRSYRLSDGHTVEIAVSFYNVALFEYSMKLLPD